MSCVVGFGDILLRLSPPGYQRFMQASNFEINYTGAEANVLASLAMNRVDVQFVTRIPTNPIAESALAFLHKYEIGTKYIASGDGRMGLFYLEKGASQRPGRCIYDRQFSAFVNSQPSDYDWERIFSNATHFHLTGITPALGNALPEICLDACRTAKRMGLTVSLDLNYRATLWSPDEAQRVMRSIVPYVDVLIGGREDAIKMLNVRVDAPNERLACEETARILVDRFDLSAVAFTMRQSTTASDHVYGAMLYHGNQSYYSKQYNIHLVDRVGGGDAFSAGLLYGLLHQFDPQHMVEFAAAAGCLKQTIEQDFNLSSAEEIERLVCSENSVRIQR